MNWSLQNVFFIALVAALGWGIGQMIVGILAAAIAKLKQ